MLINGYQYYGATSADKVPNNSIFRDIIDNKLKLKDNTGTLITLN